MIDLHCHILPGVDDGPASLEESLRMARMLTADGVSHVVATPHCHKFIHLLRNDILPRVQQLNADLHERDVPLTILPGSEIQVTDSALYRREFTEHLYCHLNDGPHFTLLEFNWKFEQFPVDAVELVLWIRDQGMTPILAHPERHDFFWNDPALLQRLVHAGAWVQITVDSLLGNHGVGPRNYGIQYLEMFPSAVLATDAHNLRRCSGLAIGYQWVAERAGPDRARDLRRRAAQVIGMDLSKDV